MKTISEIILIILAGACISIGIRVIDFCLGTIIAGVLVATGVSVAGLIWP